MTQEKAILRWLRSGNRITPLEALKRFGTLRLGARIYDLRRNGYNIKTDRVKTRGGAVVASYRLDRHSTP